MDSHSYLDTSKVPREVVKTLYSWSVDFSWCESGHNVPVNLDKIIIILVIFFNA